MGIDSKGRTDGKKRIQPSAGGLAYFALLRTADALKNYFETIIEPFDITGQQYNVLRILRGAGSCGLPTLTIAERMIERAPGITRMIDRLVTKELVWRENCPNDRRRVYCGITEKGLGLLDRLDGPVDETNMAFDALDGKELAQLTSLLERVRKVHESN